MQDQRYLFTFTPDVEEAEPQSITIGVWAKKYNQARQRVYQYLIDRGYDVGVDSRLEGRPSNISADIEISQESVQSV